MRSSYFTNNDGAHVRLQGLFNVTATAGATTTFTYTMPYDRMITGMSYKITNWKQGDKIDFEVHHPTAGLLDNFASGYYCKEEEEFCCYGARLYAGLQLKLTYYSTGTSNVDIIMNGYLHTFPNGVE